MSFYSVAIDGPAGAGKSTIAKQAAADFGFIYVDTGAMYRTIGLAARQRNLDPKDAEAITAMLPEISVTFGYGADGLQHMHLDGVDVNHLIRTPEISMYASAVSAIPAVRAYLLNQQRDMAKTQNIIMDGRDIGTVILPNAGLKIFLTASVENRAKRRMLELEQKGEPQPYEEVLADMQKRDYDDTHRAAAPLKAAEDAVLLDTSDLDLPASIAAVEAMIRERFSL